MCVASANLSLIAERRALASEARLMIASIQDVAMYIYIYIIYIATCTVYVRVASRNCILTHIPRFEKMADELGATEHSLY